MLKDLSDKGEKSCDLEKRCQFLSLSFFFLKFNTFELWMRWVYIESS